MESKDSSGQNKLRRGPAGRLQTGAKVSESESQLRGIPTSGLKGQTGRQRGTAQRVLVRGIGRPGLVLVQGVPLSLRNFGEMTPWPLFLLRRTKGFCWEGLRGLLQLGNLTSMLE